MGRSRATSPAHPSCWRRRGSLWRHGCGGLRCRGGGAGVGGCARGRRAPVGRGSRRHDHRDVGVEVLVAIDDARRDGLLVQHGDHLLLLRLVVLLARVLVSHASVGSHAGVVSVPRVVAVDGLHLRRPRLLLLRQRRVDDAHLERMSSRRARRQRAAARRRARRCWARTHGSSLCGWTKGSFLWPRYSNQSGSNEARQPSASR